MDDRVKKIKIERLKSINANADAFQILEGLSPKNKKFKSFQDINGNNVWHYLAFSKKTIETYSKWKEYIEKEDYNHLNIYGIHFMDYLFANGKTEEYLFFKNEIKELKNNENCLIHLILMQKEIKIIEKVVLNNIKLINSVDSYGNTPLKIATINQPIEVIEILLKNGADPNITDDYNKTPLHYVAEMNDIDKFNLLESYYADDTVKNTLGKTPLDMLKKAGNRNPIEIERVIKHSKSEFYKFKTLEY